MACVSSTDFDNKCQFGLIWVIVALDAHTAIRCQTRSCLVKQSTVRIHFTKKVTYLIFTVT